MAKYTKLNELQKAIDKVNVDVAEMQQPIAVLEDKRTEVITALQGVEAEVSEMLEDSSRMVAMEYFKKRQKISDYQRQITMLDSNIAELKENAKIVEKGLNKQLYEDYLDTDYVDTHPVINEFEANTLELQREAFALMCQVEKVMDKIEAQGKKYREVSQQIEYRKAKYQTFETVGKITRLMKRFGLRDNRIKYCTAVSYDLEDFEK